MIISINEKNCDKKKIASIIVTFNRKELLKNCLKSLINQTLLPDLILIIDNASTDGTENLLKEEPWLNRNDIEIILLNKNTGGSGGFFTGLKNAFDRGYDWIWLMDDDALPHPEALEKVVNVANHPSNIYGSTAVSGHHLCWPMSLLSNKKERIIYATDLPTIAEVEFIPFLGFLIHRSLIARIGLPEKDFFITADDVEYCQRAKNAGAKCLLAANSLIEHPPSTDYPMDLLWRKIWCLQLPPWKRYYDTRNRLLLAKKHYGLAYYYQTIPGSLIRLTGALLFEKHRKAQLWAFMAGFIDGLLGRKGMRHNHWGIPL
jgi:rhamnopyranosyl-N-acetylglucosaminyl-diphospho-decaprenol beta-1,3/1,4-galactofuranosyltransferase